MYKLICNQSPNELGIANDQGDWDMLKLKEHITNCPVCSGFILRLMLKEEVTSIPAAMVEKEQTH